MKKNFLLSFFFFFLFSFLCINLYSQDKNIKIFVPSVEGVGSKDDNSYFIKQLNDIIKTQGQSPSRFMAGSDYILKSTIVKYSEFEQTELTQNREGSYEFVFVLELLDTRTSELYAAQYIVYNNVEPGLDKTVSEVVLNILSNLMEVDGNKILGDQKIFVGASLYWLPKMYQKDAASIYWQNFGFGISGEYYFLDYLAAELGFLISQDWVIVIKDIEEHKDLLLEIPAAVKYTVKPADNIFLSPLAGLSLNFSLNGKTTPSIISIFFGMQFGIKAGIGIITIDPRFNLDLLDSKITSPEIASEMDYRRNTMQVGIGYKIGLGKHRIIDNPQPAPSQTAPSTTAPAPAPQTPAPRQPRERSPNNQIFF